MEFATSGSLSLSGIAQGEAQFLEICPSEEGSYKYFLFGKRLRLGNLLEVSESLR